MNKSEILHVSCPTCHKLVEWNEKNPYRPFCCKRCQLIDLGDWANEDNRIPSDDIISDDEVWSDNIVNFHKDND